MNKNDVTDLLWGSNGEAGVVDFAQSFAECQHLQTLSAVAQVSLILILLFYLHGRLNLGENDAFCVIGNVGGS